MLSSSADPLKFSSSTRTQPFAARSGTAPWGGIAGTATTGAVSGKPVRPRPTAAATTSARRVEIAHVMESPQTSPAELHQVFPHPVDKPGERNNGVTTSPLKSHPVGDVARTATRSSTYSVRDRVQ